MSAAGALAGPLRSLLLVTMAREHEDVLVRAEAENWGYRRFLRSEERRVGKECW